jgi:hypothetical protein
MLSVLSIHPRLTLLLPKLDLQKWLWRSLRLFLAHDLRQVQRFRMPAFTVRFSSHPPADSRLYASAILATSLHSSVMKMTPSVTTHAIDCFAHSQHTDTGSYHPMLSPPHTMVLVSEFQDFQTGDIGILSGYDVADHVLYQSDIMRHTSGTILSMFQVAMLHLPNYCMQAERKVTRSSCS